MQKARVWLAVLVALGLALFLTGCVLVDDGVEHLVLDAAWDATADTADFDGAVGSTYVITFPAGGTAIDEVYGEFIYTDDSYIASAAVWEGRITEIAGGTIKIEILDGQASYDGGTLSNGITTLTYGSWPRSFQFVAYP